MDVFFGDFCAYLLLIKGKHRPSLEWGCGPPDSASFPAHLWLLPPAPPLPPWLLRSFLRLSVKRHPPFFSLTACVVLHQVRDHSLWSNSSRLWSQHIFNPTEINSFSFFHPPKCVSLNHFFTRLCLLSPITAPLHCIDMLHCFLSLK